MKASGKNELGHRLQRHFQEVLSITIAPRSWPGENTLPVFLRDLYAFLAARVLGMPCLFLLDKDARPISPAIIRKHLFEVARRWDGEVIYVTTGINSGRRKRLIDQHIPFVVPGNQIYLPMLGIDLREHFRSTRGAPQSFSPATQATLLYAFHRKEREELSLREMAAALGYTGMTLSRAFDQLESAGIGSLVMKGRSRLFGLPGSRRDHWEKARPLLRSPVARRLFVQGRKSEEAGPPAGYSALAVYTTLAGPKIPVIAAASTTWESRRGKLGLRESDADDADIVEVELWTYAPQAIAEGRAVDRLSLYLSVAGTADERVEAALDELLEGMDW
jgi:hypothetical protein